MKRKVIVGRLRDGGYNSMAYTTQTTVDRVKGCEFDQIFLFGDFTEYEMSVIMPCVGNDMKNIIKVS